MHRLRPGVRAFVVLGPFLAALVLAPRLGIGLRCRDRVHGAVEDVPAADVGVVLGAYVHEGGVLSDAARERAEAAVRLYRAGGIERVLVSGDDRSNRQAQAIADHVRAGGVAGEDVLVDGLGIDTHDTCRHLADVASGGVLLTQGYHLPRAMWMCERDGLDVAGLAVDRLGILEARGESAWAIVATRVVRFVRESLLTWAHVLGIYDRVSNEAETLEGVPEDAAREGVILAARWLSLAAWLGWLIAYWRGGVTLVTGLVRSSRRDTLLIGGLVALAVVMLWTGILVVGGRLPAGLVLTTEPLVLAGGALVLVGAAGTFHCRRRLGDLWSARSGPSTAHRLIDHGPYRLVRHPIYAFASLKAVGTILLFATWWNAAAGGLMVVLYALKGVGEEAVLLEKLPGYRAYRERVRRRMVPWIW